MVHVFIVETSSLVGLTHSQIDRVKATFDQALQSEGLGTGLSVTKTEVHVAPNLGLKTR